MDICNAKCPTRNGRQMTSGSGVRLLGRVPELEICVGAAALLLLDRVGDFRSRVLLR